MPNPIRKFAKEMLGALRPSKVGPEFERADEMLQGPAAEALRDFIGHGPKAHLHGGSSIFDPFALDKIDDIPEMEPLRDRLHGMFGNTMPLMRSQYPVPGFPPHRKYLSWTSDPAFAQDHAGMIPKIPPFYDDAFIRQMEDDYAREGLAKISKSKELRREVQPPEWAHLPDYPQIYHGNEHITDADSVRHYMDSLNEDHRYYKDLNEERARKIQMERIPLEDLLWGTDRANQSEFIVRNKAEGGPVNTPTEGEGGLYAAPNSTFDTPPPYDWGYRPGGAHADGGPVEMAGGGLVERLARAAAQGFDVTKKWYHSAVEPIEQFQPHGQFMGRSGVSGIHLTDDPKVASRFLDRYGDYNYKGEPFAKNVMPLYVNPGRILERDERFPSALGMGFPIPDNYRSPVEQMGYDSLLRNDAITGRGTVGHVDPSNRGRFDLPYRELILHDPKRVRSIFDPFEDGFAGGGPVEMAGGGFFKRLARSVAGKPDTVKLPDVGNVPAQPLAELEDISQRFAMRHGNQYPIESYSPLDEERARRIAQEYDSMQHNPFDPATKRSYEALVDETMDQYRALEDTGVDFSFLKPGEADPYARNPALGYLDLIENGRLKMFPTSDGFGTLNETTNNPLLKRVGRVGDLEDATANDAFRIVHDMLGHYGPGNPFFRSKGEERAWQAHGRAYSPDALPAATSELRGQNSWVNYGPHGETNRTASGADTIYADQKVGLMPPWTWLEKADGGPVEMALGGTTPVSTGGQYQPRESKGPGFFRNQDNYDNSSAGGINFIKNFVQDLSPAQREAQRLVSEATRKTGKEALVFGRGDDPNELTSLTHGNYESVKIPDYYHQFASQSADPFFSLHSHPTSTLAPSTADLNLWGNRYPATLGLPYQSMLINASPQDSVLRLGAPGKSMTPVAASRVADVLNFKRENDDLVSYHGFMDPRIKDFLRANKLPDLAHEFHADAAPMPGVTKYLDNKYPGTSQDVSVRDLYAGNFLQRIAERGIPVEVSAEHRIAGTPYLAQDVWPEFAAHVKRHALPKAEGGPIEMEKGGALRKAAAAVKRLASDPAWDSAKANAAQYEIAGMGKGAGPLDLSDLDQRIPGILQEAIPRIEPPRGVSPRLQDALSNPRVLSGIEDSIRYGQTLGADKWYHNNPLYQAFVRELGPEQGHADFMKYMDYQSAASPRSDVPTNIRNASYYFTNEGKDPRSWTEMPANPAPYGHIAQALHRANADVVRGNDGGWGGYDVFKNPKPPSYGTNLGGNLLPVALDSHAFKNIGMRSEDPRFLMTSLSDFLKIDPFSDAKLAEADDVGGRLSFAQQYGTPGAMKDGKYRVDYKPQQLVTSGRLSMDEALTRPVLWDAKPRDNEYAAGEKMYQQMGFDMGIDPADAQSAAWAGAGKLTGLGTPPDKTFGQMHNERVLLTAKLRGEDPEETLRKLIRREAPLFAEGGTVEDEYHPIWQQSFAGGGQPEEEPRGYYSPKERAAIARRQNAERLAQEDVEINQNPGAHWRDLLTQIPRGAASIAELPGLVGDIMNLRADYLDSVAPGSSPSRIPHWGTSEGISKGIDSLFPETTSRYGGETGRALGSMSLNALGLGIANNAGRVARSLGHVGNSANLASILGGGPGGDMEPTEQQPPSAPSYAYEQFLRSQDPTYRAFEAERPFYGMAQGGHAKDTGNTFDFLGPFGAGLNIIADGAGAIFGGEDFELDKALGYLGEIGGSLVAPGVGGALGRGAGEIAAHLIEPGEGGNVGQSALNAGYGAMRGGAGMFFAHGGSTGFLPQDEEDPNDLTRFLSPQVNPSVQPDPMDWAAANGVPGAISPPLNANNGQVARDAAERQRLMSMAEGASKQALQSQSQGSKGGGGGMGDLTQIASMAMKFLPMMMAAEGGPVDPNGGEQPWMYGDGALMARGGYLRGCGGMNG